MPAQVHELYYEARIESGSHALKAYRVVADTKEEAIAAVNWEPGTCHPNDFRMLSEKPVAFEAYPPNHWHVYVGFQSAPGRWVYTARQTADGYRFDAAFHPISEEAIRKIRENFRNDMARRWAAFQTA